MAKTQATQVTPLGTGGKFAALKEKLAQNTKVKNPNGLASIIGRRTLGRNKTATVATDGTPGF